MTQEEQIIIYETRLIEAMKVGDFKTLDILLDDNLLFHNPMGDIITKEIDLENYRTKRMSVSNISILERIILTKESISIVSVAIRLQAKYEDKVIDGNYKYLRVWKINEGTWKVIAGCAHSI